MRIRGVAATTLVTAATLTIGCGSDPGSDASGSTVRPELVVFAASSLGPAFERYGSEFADADVRFSFAGSDDLAAQIRQGVVPDVYAAADTALVAELAAEGLLQTPRAFATNELVLGVPVGSRIDAAEDLEDPDVSVAIGTEDVPVGIYAREAIDSLGASAADAILDNVATAEPDVAGIVAKLTQGAVDAGFVYGSDVDASSGRLEAVALPAQARPDVVYAIAVASGAPEPALAQQFADGLRIGIGRRDLRAAGFGPPPSDR